MIADRTAYDVRFGFRFTGKLSNRFRLQVNEQLLAMCTDPAGEPKIQNAQRYRDGRTA